jgi:hypothetical protein
MKVVVIPIPHVPWSLKQTFMSASIVINNIKEAPRHLPESALKEMGFLRIMSGLDSSGS